MPPARDMWKVYVKPSIIPLLVGGMISSATWLFTMGQATANANATQESEHKRLEALTKTGDDNVTKLVMDGDSALDKRVAVLETAIEGRMQNIETTISRLERAIDKMGDALVRMNELIAKGGKRP